MLLETLKAYKAVFLLEYKFSAFSAFQFEFEVIRSVLSSKLRQKIRLTPLIVLGKILGLIRWFAIKCLIDLGRHRPVTSSRERSVTISIMENVNRACVIL